MAIKYSLSWPIETQTHTHTDTCDYADQSDVRLGCVCVFVLNQVSLQFP